MLWCYDVINIALRFFLLYKLLTWQKLQRCQKCLHLLEVPNLIPCKYRLRVDFFKIINSIQYNLKGIICETDIDIFTMV